MPCVWSSFVQHGVSLQKSVNAWSPKKLQGIPHLRTGPWVTMPHDSASYSSLNSKEPDIRQPPSSLGVSCVHVEPGTGSTGRATLVCQPLEGCVRWRRCVPP